MYCYVDDDDEEKDEREENFLFILSFLLFSITHFVRKLFDMASIRSISTSKHSENLADRRLNRAATTSSIPNAQKKLTANNKSPSIIISTIRRKSPRMSLKKDLTGSTSTAISLSNQISNSSYDLPVEQMTSMKVQDTSHRRSRSKPSHTTSNCTAQPHFDTDTSYDGSHTDRSELSSASARSSLNDNLFTLEAFEPIRTVGTGKNILIGRKPF